MGNDSHSTHDAEEDPRNRDRMIYLDGKIVSREEAKVSVYDSGFMLGDGMWEGMRLYNGKWAFFDEHMDRLFNSCKTVSIVIGLDEAGILEALNRAAAANGTTADAHCRLMVTRGRKTKPFQHPGLARFGATVVMIMEHSKAKSSLQSEGISLAMVPKSAGFPCLRTPSSTASSPAYRPNRPEPRKR